MSKGEGMGKEEEGKGEREIVCEALSETEKIANAPRGNRTWDPSKRGWCSTIEQLRQTTSPASLFEILSALPPLHNRGIIQCPQTNPLCSGLGVCDFPFLPKLHFRYPCLLSRSLHFSFPSPFDLSHALKTHPPHLSQKQLSFQTVHDAQWRPWRVAWVKRVSLWALDDACVVKWRQSG